MAREHKYRPRTAKHMHVKYYHFCLYVDSKQISIHHICTDVQHADILTKPLAHAPFIRHCHTLMGWWYIQSILLKIIWDWGGVLDIYIHTTRTGTVPANHNIIILYIIHNTNIYIRTVGTYSIILRSSTGKDNLYDVQSRNNKIYYNYIFYLSFNLSPFVLT